MYIYFELYTYTYLSYYIKPKNIMVKSIPTRQKQNQLMEELYLCHVTDGVWSVHCACQAKRRTLFQKGIRYRSRNATKISNGIIV